MPAFHRQIGVQSHGETPFLAAALAGDRLGVARLLASSNVDDQDSQGWTALQLAAAHGHSQVVETLLNNGADPNLRNKQGRTALMYASAFGHLAIVRSLLCHHADPNAVSAGADVGTSFMGTGDAGESALMLASWSGWTEVIDALLDAGADPNLKGGPLGGTALHSALWEGFICSVERLIRNKTIKLHEVDSSGHTAREAALRMGRTEIARLLEEAETKAAA